MREDMICMISFEYDDRLEGIYRLIDGCAQKKKSMEVS